MDDLVEIISHEILKFFPKVEVFYFYSGQTVTWVLIPVFWH